MTITRLINSEDISRLARPCYADEELAGTCILEAQNIDLRNQLGDALYMAIFDEGATSERIAAILEPQTFGDCCGASKMHFGLLKALAYYAYARIVKTGSNMQTRYGMVAKTHEYSENTSLKERIAAYEDAFATADSYMAGVLDYIVANNEKYPEYCKGGKMSNNRVRFNMIGN